MQHLFIRTHFVLIAKRLRSGVLRTQKLKTHLLIIQSSKVFLLSLEQVRIAMHATPAARDLFLANFYPSGPFTRIFSKTSPEFFLRWLWLTLVRVWARRIK